jgi:hypothetical protein
VVAGSSPAARIVWSWRVIKHYLNLSNGVEALEVVQATGEPWSFCRIRSTTFERERWHTLFMNDVSDDLLMHLALGWICVLHDRGTLRPQSKTCYLGVPLIAYVLRRRWSGFVPDRVPMYGPRGGAAPDAAERFDAIYRETVEANTREAGIVRQRFDYFARYYAGQPVRFVSRSESTTRDGDVAYQVAAVESLRPCLNPCVELFRPVDTEPIRYMPLDRFGGVG